MLLRRMGLLAVLVSAGYASDLAVDPDVLYRTVQGVELRMDVARPSGDGPFPAVICLHGGGWSMGSKGSFRRVMPELTEGGFVVAAIQYRLAPKFIFPAQADDTLEAIRFLRSNAGRWNIDPRRIVLMGASAGAHLALLAGFKAAGTGDEVQAIVNISAPADLRDWKMSDDANASLQRTTGKTSDMLVTELLGVSDRTAKIVRTASPLLQVRPGLPPVLTFHWKDDRAVPATQAERLIGALNDAGVKNEVVWFEGRGHAFGGPGAETIPRRTAEFLHRVLRPQ